MNASVDFAAEGCYDYRSERTVSASVSYESHAGEGDKAVLYTIPMVYYEYEIENEETGGKGVMAAPVSLGAQTSVVNVEAYDRIAKQHNMTPLSYFLTNRSGEPGTYQTTLNGETPVGDSFGLGKPGVTRAYTHDGFNGAAAQSGASIEQTIEVEEGKEQELELGLTLNGSVVMGAKLAKHELFGGLCFGANAGFTTGNSSSESTEYGGTVDNLPEAAQGKYGFVWRLGVNAVDVDKFEADSGDKLGTKDTDQFWIVGYDVKDVEMPDAPAVTGFTANAVDSTALRLAGTMYSQTRVALATAWACCRAMRRMRSSIAGRLPTTRRPRSSGMGCSPIRSIDSPSPPLRMDPRPKQVFARQSSRSRPCPMA